MNNPESKKPRILIIDDELCVGNILSEFLSGKYLCQTAASADDVLRIIENEKFDLVLSDIDLGAASGIEIIPQILQNSPDTVIMMSSGKQIIESAIEVMRAGAFDYIK